MTKLSDFFRDATPEEREAVYNEVVEQVIAEQQMAIAKSKAIAARGRQAILDAELKTKPATESKP